MEPSDATLEEEKTARELRADLRLERETEKGIYHGCNLGTGLPLGQAT